MGFFATLGHLLDASIGAALLQRAPFEAVFASDRFALVALAVPVLAGASELAGQGIVLASQPLKRRDVAISLIFTGLIYALSVAVWTLAAHLILAWESQNAPGDYAILGLISLGFAPRLLAVLSVAPYYGEGLDRFLDIWSFGCVAWGFWLLTGGPFLLVMLAASTGWLASFALRRYGGRLTVPLVAAIERNTAAPT